MGGERFLRRPCYRDRTFLGNYGRKLLDFGENERLKYVRMPVILKSNFS